MASISSKVVMRQYYLRCGLILVCYLAVIFPCIYLYPNVWSIMFCTALYLPVKLLIRIIANKTIASVLFTKLDAIEFQKLIQQKKFLPPLDYRINAAMFTGDYQTTVNIATSRIKKRSSIRVKYLYLCILAQAYFELRDFEKLQKLLTEYDNYRAKHSSKSFFSPSYSVWSYYRYFLEHDYQACKILCKERNLGIRPNSWDAKLIRLKNDFFYAVACYENQEIDEAKKHFESIISHAPKINLSSISKKYLVAIEQNLEYPFATYNVLPDSNFQIFDSKIETKIRCYRVIQITGIAVVALLLIISSVFDDSAKKERIDTAIYEEKLNIALQAQYDEYSIINFFNLSHNDEIIDALCIVEDAKGQCDIGFVVTSDGGNTFDFICAVNNIEQGNRHVVNSPTGMHSIAIDIGLKSQNDYDKKVKIAFDNSEVSIGFLYLSNTDL